MTEVKYKARFHGLLRLTAGLVLVNLALFVIQYWPRHVPTPYSDVELREALLTEDQQLVIHADFVKIGCVFERLSVVGIGLTGAHLLEWVDDDALGPAYDRAAGIQSLRVKISLGDFKHDRIEIRTRHDCDGELVDKLFLEYTL